MGENGREGEGKGGKHREGEGRIGEGNIGEGKVGEVGREGGRDGWGGRVVLIPWVM